MQFSTILQTRRLERNLSQSGLAELSGMTQSRVSTLERGTPPSWLDLARLRHVLDLDVAAIVVGICDELADRSE